MNLRVFNIQKSDTPDIYKLYDDMNECNGCACVDSLKTSKYLSTIFKQYSLTTKIKMKCRRTTNEHFTNVWIPCEIVEQ